MRQRTLNGVLVGAVAIVFCVLAAAAYSAIREADYRSTCVLENRAGDEPATKCENCPVTRCAIGQRR